MCSGPKQADYRAGVFTSRRNSAKSGSDSESGFDTAHSDAYYGTAASEAETKGRQNRALRLVNQPLPVVTEHRKLLHSKGLRPVDPIVEQNWSGRGQHVEFQRKEKHLIDQILKVEDLLGSTGSAVVQSVRCRRILLARKTIRCNRSMTREKAIDEVTHLSRLHHSHVIRVMGTYVFERDLSILLYPVAEYDMGTFLNGISAGPLIEDPLARVDTLFTLQNFLPCLSNATEHVHENMTKHMDIKPINTLVKRSEDSWKVYLADFGIARSYKTYEDIETEGPTTFTRKYAAPEVVSQDKRGLAADIFSQGCVFVEILATACDIIELWVCDKGTDEWRLQALRQSLQANEYGDASYQANLDIVHHFLDGLFFIKIPNGLDTILNDLDSLFSNHGVARFSPGTVPLPLRICTVMVQRMMNEEPYKRPSAKELVYRMGTNLCCTHQQEELAAD